MGSPSASLISCPGSSAGLTACAASFSSFILLLLLDILNIKFELLRRLRRHRYHPKISQTLQSHGRSLFEALEVCVRDIRFQNDRHHIAYKFHTGRTTSSASSPIVYLLRPSASSLRRNLLYSTASLRAL